MVDEATQFPIAFLAISATWPTAKFTIAKQLHPKVFLYLLSLYATPPPPLPAPACKTEVKLHNAKEETLVTRDSGSLATNWRSLLKQCNVALDRSETANDW